MTDIKPDSFSEENHFLCYLVDFGIATSYLNSSGQHIQTKTLEIFQGNMLFTSIN